MSAGGGFGRLGPGGVGWLGQSLVGGMGLVPGLEALYLSCTTLRSAPAASPASQSFMATCVDEFKPPPWFITSITSNKSCARTPRSPPPPSLLVYHFLN